MEDFTSCARKALGTGAVNIQIDVSKNKSALGAVLPLTIQLNAILAKHGKFITILGLGTDGNNPFIKKLVEMGIAVDDVVQPETSLTRQHPAKMDPVAASPSPALPGRLQESGTRKHLVVDDLVLPPVEEMTKQLMDARAALAKFLKVKEELEKEIAFYKARQKDLIKGRAEGATPEQLQELQALDKRLLDRRSELSLAKKKADQLRDDRGIKENMFKKFAIEFKNQLKKKESDLKSKVESLQKDLEKVKADYQRRSDNRRAELLRLRSGADETPKS